MGLGGTRSSGQRHDLYGRVSAGGHYIKGYDGGKLTEIVLHHKVPYTEFFGMIQVGG